MNSNSVVELVWKFPAGVVQLVVLPVQLGKFLTTLLSTMVALAPESKSIFMVFNSNLSWIARLTLSRPKSTGCNSSACVVSSLSHFLFWL